jgi:hypothetical protein
MNIAGATNTPNQNVTVNPETSAARVINESVLTMNMPPAANAIPNARGEDENAGDIGEL